MGGFTVIRVWEHEIKGNPQAVAEVIAELISLSVRVDGELPDRRSC